MGEWAVEEPTVFPGLEGDKALVIKSKAAHHAISVPFETAYNPNGKTTVISYGQSSLLLLCLPPDSGRGG